MDKRDEFRNWQLFGQRSAVFNPRNIGSNYQHPQEQEYTAQGIRSLHLELWQVPKDLTQYAIPIAPVELCRGLVPNVKELGGYGNCPGGTGSLTPCPQSFGHGILEGAHAVRQNYRPPSVSALSCTSESTSAEEEECRRQILLTETHSANLSGVSVQSQKTSVYVHQKTRGSSFRQTSSSAEWSQRPKVPRKPKKPPAPTTLCRYGDKCYKGDCNFGHPTKKPIFIPRYPRKKDAETQTTAP